MEEVKVSFKDIVVNVALIINKRIIDEIEEDEYVKHIETYIRETDNLYIYNMTNQDLTSFFDKLSKYNNILYTNCNDLGEVNNYQRILDQFLLTDCDFGVVLNQGYYYEEEAFLSLRRYATEHNTSKIAVLTPMPLRGCEQFFMQVEEERKCKGCNLVGTLINMKIFKELSPFKLDYYQTTFDYEYCLRARQKGYQIIILQNQVLRNQNYRIIEKKFFFITIFLIIIYNILHINFF